MIFVDTNVVVYAVGGAHPLRGQARRFFEQQLKAGRKPLCTSAEVLQELLHIYLPVGRIETLNAARTLVESCVDIIWSVELEDVQLACMLAHRYPDLGARDLLHLASCHRRDVSDIKTFDPALAAAFRKSIG